MGLLLVEDPLQNLVSEGFEVKGIRRYTEDAEEGREAIDEASDDKRG